MDSQFGLFMRWKPPILSRHCLAVVAAGTVAWSTLNVSATNATHWAFLPLHAVAPPVVTASNWVRNPIDSFVLAQLQEKHLAPSQQADARKLARRIYFDVIGLPPTPEQIEKFTAAYEKDSRSAVAALVDELLASPHFGERWARHWLDVARYADSDGQESDRDRPTAYHYRDFVIRAFNEDLPADTFLRWQLAGDEIEPDNPLAVAATGFIIAGTHIVLDVPMEEEKIRTRYNELDDMIATTGSAMLGLTLACARCHDHKYDAIPTRDYYSMLGAFNSGDQAQVPLAPLLVVRRHRQAESKWKAEFDAAKKPRDEFLAKVRKEHERTAISLKIDKLTIAEEEKTLLKNEPDSTRAKELSKKFSKELKVEDKEYRSLATTEERAEWEKLDSEVTAAEARKPRPLPTTLAFADFSAKPRDNWLLARGDFRLKKEPLELGFLSVLTRGKTAADYLEAACASRQRDDSTQQRRALANWMTDCEHGAGTLAARVLVNRIWQHHFGEGLVRTVSDFGVRGQPATHRELLEWLTSQFVKGGWRLKSLHRLIMTSSTYLQESAFDAAKAKIDPENRLLWRQTPRRVEAEILRDAILAVSGTLNPQMFGPAFKPPIAAEAIQARNVTDPYPKDLKDTAATRRRSIYMFHKRVVQYPLMQVFDGPDAQASCGRREHTTVAPQALALLNEPFVRARAEDFARRIVNATGSDVETQVRQAWRLALARVPSETELRSSAEFINNQIRARSDRGPGAVDTAQLALADFAQAIFAFNEFIYVD
jgi:hypothetical protein